MRHRRQQIAVGEGRSSHRFHGRLRFRIQLEQRLGIFPRLREILLLQAHGGQVGKRFLRLGILQQHLLVEFRCFVQPTGLLQRHGLAEQRFLVVGILEYVAIEGVQRFFRTLQMHQAGAQAEVRFRPPRIDFERLFKRRRSLGPARQLPQADGHVEVAGAMGGLQLEQLRIAVHGLGIILHFVLHVAECGKQRRMPLARFDGAVQLAHGIVQLAFQVQRNRL